MAFTGEKAQIKTGLNTVTKMESWKLGIKANQVDITSFDSDGWEETATSTKAWELSMEGTFDKTDSTGQMEVLKQLSLGGDVPIELFTNKDDAVADFKGNIKVESVDIDTSVKDKLKISIKAKGNGKLEGVEAAVAV